MGGHRGGGLGLAQGEGRPNRLGAVGHGAGAASARRGQGSRFAGQGPPRPPGPRRPLMVHCHLAAGLRQSRCWQVGPSAVVGSSPCGLRTDFLQLFLAIHPRAHVDGGNPRWRHSGDDPDSRVGARTPGQRVVGSVRIGRGRGALAGAAFGPVEPAVAARGDSCAASRDCGHDTQRVDCRRHCRSGAGAPGGPLPDGETDRKPVHPLPRASSSSRGCWHRNDGPRLRGPIRSTSGVPSLVRFPRLRPLSIRGATDSSPGDASRAARQLLSAIPSGHWPHAHACLSPLWTRRCADRCASRGARSGTMCG